MSESLKPILSSVGGSAVMGDGISVAPQDGTQGAPAKIVVVDGGEPHDCKVYDCAPMANVGSLKSAETYVIGVAQLVSGIPDSDVLSLFEARRGFACEELRDPSHVSDYVSLADYATTVGYKEYPMRSVFHNVIWDGTVVRSESSVAGVKAVRTSNQECKHVPIKEPLLTKDRKGNIVEVRIEYKREERVDGETHHVHKCTIQRLYLNRREDGTAYSDRMFVRYIYTKTSVATVNTEVKTTASEAAAAIVAKTRFQRAGQATTEDAPIRLVITDMQKTPSFMLAFNEERVVLYCLDTAVTEYRITSCKAIRSATVHS